MIKMTGMNVSCFISCNSFRLRAPRIPASDLHSSALAFGSVCNQGPTYDWHLMRLTHDVVPCDRGIAYMDGDVAANRVQYGSRRRGRRGQDNINRSADFDCDLVN